jgi:hypothetical protein
MVARPSVIGWASDANLSSGPDAGLPAKETPAPSGGVITQGFIPGLPLFAPRLNWVLNALDAAISYFLAIVDSQEEHTYQVAKTAVYLIPGCEIKPGDGYLDGAGAYDARLNGPSAEIAAGWMPGQLPASNRFVAGAGPGGRDLLNPNIYSICQTPYNEGVLPLLAPLQSGYILTSVDFYVTGGALAATADDRMQCTFSYWDVSTGLITVMETAAVANLTSNQTVTLTINPTFTANRANFIPILQVRASKTADANPDMFRGARLTFTYQGPRSA